MDLLISTESLIALLTLTSLEVVLGIDNIIFISILVDKLPAHQRPLAQKLGLGLAMMTRLALLLSLNWIMGLEDTLLTVSDHAISGRDIILLAGGLFLIWKSTHEIHQSLEGTDSKKSTAPPSSSDYFSGHFFLTLAQIAIIDIVFSLDSVITAVGLANELWVMVTAIIIATVVMIFAVQTISDFVNKHPTIKILALSFLILIGLSLLAEGLNFHIPKNYIYFTMLFSFIIELLNSRVRK